jgi:uncharacterized repeat protein (TIGR02543 family)
MSVRRRILRRVFTGAALALLLASSALAIVLPVPVVIQEKDQWCWAGSTKAVINYYGTNVSQCQIAEWVRTHNNWHDFGSVNCCTNADVGCNYWNYLYGGGASVQDILNNWGLTSSIWYREMSLSEVSSFVNDNRPFVIRWGWDSGGGHFLVGHGLEGNNLYYMNPWPGEGAEIASYDWVVRGSDHTWTHGAGVTTPYVVVNRTLNIQAQTGGTTTPAPGSYTKQNGTSVTIYATPWNWYTFTGWTGSVTSSANPINVTVSSNMTLTANFRLIEGPASFSGTRVLNRSLSQAEYINVLSWEANSKNAGLDVVGYRIYVKDSSGSRLLTETDADTFALRHRGVDPKSEYIYDIYAILGNSRSGKPSSVIID